ncbi:MAG: 2-phospho-L-lactate guanylyltransferase [Gammaproteobacteria bacterium]|nr:2-phospho-L-lactate guanylyltransferase [Gammaproteobacteria bacterium]
MWAIVPYKEPPFGKSRLSNRLTPSQRTVLAATMLDIVVEALLRAKHVQGILLVSDSTNLAEFTLKENIIILETQTTNLRDAVTQASRFASKQLRCPTTFIVPADLPLISPEDIDFAVTQHEQVTIIPDARLKGTNGIIATPPNAFEFVFNGQSYQHHQHNAQVAGLHPKSLQIETFSYDVDTFDDLMLVIQMSPDSRTAAVYRNLTTHDSSLPACN